MTKARDLANASTALSAVSATELAFVDGVTSAIQTQLDSKVSTAGGSTVTVASGTTVPLTIQNNGTGNSLVVNDEASDTSAFIIDASGKLVVGGTTASSNKATIIGGNSNTLALDNTGEQYTTLNINNNGTNKAYMYWDNSASILTYGTATTGATVFSTNNSERMRIDSSGNTTINTIADGTTTTAAVGGGYMGLPQNSTTTGAYGVVAADAGKHIYSTATRTVTIPANSSVAFPVGTAISFVAATGATVTIAITTDTMYLAGPGTTGSRTLAPFGMATALKITSTSWIISGNGLT